jgi:hypothetical protein
MISLLASYFCWHYTTAYKELSKHFKNFLWFFYHFFSMPVLLRTYFEPWKRMEERYPKGLDIGGMASTFLINSMMRLIGALMRSVILLIGVIALAIVFCLGIACFVVWTVLPWLALLVFISGIRLIFS